MPLEDLSYEQWKSWWSKPYRRVPVTQEAFKLMKSQDPRAGASSQRLYCGPGAATQLAP